MFSSAWFIGLLIALILVALFFVLLCLIQQNNGGIYHGQFAGKYADHAARWSIHIVSMYALYSGYTSQSIHTLFYKYLCNHITITFFIPSIHRNWSIFAFSSYMCIVILCLFQWNGIFWIQ